MDLNEGRRDLDPPRPSFVSSFGSTTEETSLTTWASVICTVYNLFTLVVWEKEPSGEVFRAVLNALSVSVGSVE